MTEQPLRWAVFMPTSMTIVEGAGSIDQAREMALEKCGLSLKPWLGRDWKIRIAEREDLEFYAMQVDGNRPSQPTARTAKAPKPSMQERLL